MSDETAIPQMEPEFGVEEASAVSAYFGSGAWITEHTKTREFAERIAAFVGAPHAIIFPNGTLSLSAALLACGVGPGDEVIVPDLTMIATATAATLIGAVPVFVDVDPRTLCMDADGARRAVTPRTKALILVSLNGRTADPVPFRALADEKSIALVEDAAQSLGSFWQGRHLGTFGDVGSFSFSTPKIISTGQGGALVTSNAAIAERLGLIRDFGRRRAGVDDHIAFGVNMKFTDLQAVVGIEQMKKLPARLARKREIWSRYQERLSGIPGLQLLPTNIAATAPWFIDIYVSDRDGLRDFLAARKISTRSFYPAIHTQPPYLNNGSFPVSEWGSSRGLWLPSSFKLSDADVDRVCDTVTAFFRR